MGLLKFIFVRDIAVRRLRVLAAGRAVFALSPVAPLPVVVFGRGRLAAGLLLRAPPVPETLVAIELS
jgi:hypothetical protein